MSHSLQHHQRRDLGLRVPLDEADRAALAGLPHNVRTLEVGGYAMREGDAPRTCSVLLSGFAFRQKIARGGERQIVGVHVPGDALDFQHLFLDVTDHSIQMLTRGEVAMIARADLQRLTAERPAIGRAIMVEIVVEASIAREWVLNVGRRDARTRAAHLLCEFAVRLEAAGLAQDHGYELPMSQEQLGDALGLTSVHVNRTLKVLEAEGLITRTRRTVRFPDWRRIRDVADFNERYLHLPAAA